MRNLPVDITHPKLKKYGMNRERYVWDKHSRTLQGSLALRELDPGCYPGMELANASPLSDTRADRTQTPLQLDQPFHLAKAAA